MIITGQPTTSQPPPSGGAWSASPFSRSGIVAATGPSRPDCLILRSVAVITAGGFVLSTGIPAEERAQAAAVGSSA